MKSNIVYSAQERYYWGLWWGENKKKLAKWKAGRIENELLMLADVPLMHHG